VTAFTTSSITLKDRHGNSTTYATTGTTTYFEGSTAGVYTDLAMGQQVKLDLTSTTPQTVTKVTICLVHVVGTVTGVVGNVITIADHSSITTVDVVPGTTTYTSGGAASTFAAVIDGAKISAVGLPGTTAGTLNANSVNIRAPRVETHASGSVTAFTTSSITLKDRHGNSTTYATTGTTTYFEGSTAGVYTDLAMGQQVKLDLTSTTPQTVTKVTICLVHVVGTVTGVVGNVITIADHSSITTVDVVPGTTTYTSGGAASTFAAVIDGAKISAVGLPGTTAGTLNANSVNIDMSSRHGDKHGHSPRDNQGNNQGSGHGHGKSFGHRSHLFVSLS
jgi:DNA-directed RNA polymerase subunit E'/Rpb7